MSEPGSPTGGRRPAEEALLAKTLDPVDVGFIATDRHGQVTCMNAVAERMLGWAHANAQGRALHQVLVPADAPETAEPINLVDAMAARGLETDPARQIVARTPGGACVPLQMTTTLMRDDGDAVRGLWIVLRDEARLREAEREAVRLAAIVNSSSDAIIGKALDGRITSWNLGAQTLFGYSASEAIGESVQMLVPAERQDHEMRALPAQLAQGAQVPTFETVCLAKDGSPVEVSVTLSAIRDDSGRMIGVSKIARDISQQRLAEAARQEADRLEIENEQMQEATRLKSGFLANMSHELRTPLNAIIGFADVLKAGTVPAASPLNAQFLGNIASSGRHLLQLINDVLDLAKVESGKFEFYPEPIVLGVLVQEVRSVLSTALSRQQIGLDIDIDPALTDIVLDAARLKQLLYNYLSNAIKFSDRGGRVSLRATAFGDAHFRVEVEDHGVGIADDDMPRLFDEFQQLDAGYSKRHQGAGLGLALLRRLVQAQGGSVGVVSRPGHGSTFHFVLNRVHGTDAPIDAFAAAPPATL